MSTFLVWIPALACYALFLGWYINWHGPVKPAEVERLMERLAASGAEDSGRNDLDTMRAFLETDDGREFFMLNLVRVAPWTVADPVTGEQRPAREVVEGYTRVFMPALFARGGHPAVIGRKVGGYFDAWGVEPDPGWTIMGLHALPQPARILRRWPLIRGSLAPTTSSSRRCRTRTRFQPSRS